MPARGPEVRKWMAHNPSDFLYSRTSQCTEPLRLRLAQQANDHLSLSELLLIPVFVSLALLISPLTRFCSSVNLVSPAQCAVRIRDPLQPFGLLGYRSIATESSNAGDEEFWVGKEIKERVEELQNAGIEPYPRRESMYPRSSFAKFERAYRKLQNGETQKDSVARAFDGEFGPRCQGTYRPLREHRENIISSHIWSFTFLHGHIFKEQKVADCRQFHSVT